MSKLGSLLKVEFKESFNSNRSKKQKMTIGALIGLIGGIFVLISILYNVLFSFAFKEEGKVYNYPVFMSFFVLFITFFSAIYRSQTILFSEKDHSILAPMPIKRSTIVASKLILFLCEEIVFSAIIMVPTIVIYGMESSSFFLSGIVLMITIPLVSVLVAVFLGFIFNILAKRFKAVKVILTILYIGFFVLIFAGSYLLNSSTNESTTLSPAVDALTKYIPILSWVKSGFVEGNILSIILYLAVVLVSTAVVVVLYAIFYESFYQMLQITAKKESYNSERLVKTNKALNTFIKKDFRAIFSNNMILLSSIVGGIVSLVVSFSLARQMNQVAANTQEQARMLNVIAPFLTFLLLTMASPASISISLENKCFWIIKTMPIDRRSYIASKIIVNQILLGVFGIINSIMLIVMCKYSIMFSISIVIIPQLLILLFGIVGVSVNLKLPRLDWANYNQIKNSPSILIMTFGGMLFDIIFIIINFVAFMFGGDIVFMIVAIVLLVLLIFAAYIILKNNCRKWMDNIEI